MCAPKSFIFWSRKVWFLKCFSSRHGSVGVLGGWGCNMDVSLSKMTHTPTRNDPDSIFSVTLDVKSSNLSFLKVRVDLMCFVPWNSLQKLWKIRLWSFWIWSPIFQCISLPKSMCFPDGSVVNNLPANTGDTRSIPHLGRSGERNVKSLQYSYQEIPWTDEPVGCSPWDHRKSDMTHLLNTQT